MAGEAQFMSLPGAAAPGDGAPVSVADRPPMLPPFATLGPARATPGAAGDAPGVGAGLPWNVRGISSAVAPVARWETFREWWARVARHRS